MREEREKLVLDLLKSEWVESNTYGLTPTISFGWFDEDHTNPQVTIPQPDEGPINGGNTGYSGQDPSTGGLHQTKTGSIDINLWAEYRDLDGASTDHPRQYLAAVEAEIERIIIENGFNPTNPDTNENPVWALAPGDSTPVPEPDKSTLFHKVQTVNYILNTASGG